MMATMAIATTAMHRAISIMVKAALEPKGLEGAERNLRRNGFHETDEKTGWPGILISGERV
jgi:hypothetical protein